MSKEPRDPNELVPASMLAGVLGLTERRIRQLTAEGVFERERKGLPLGKNVQRYLAHRERGSGKTTYEQERTEHERVKRELAELDLAELRGELLPADATDRVVVALAQIVKGRLLGLPTKLAPALAAAGEPKECAAILERAINEALEALAESAS